MPRFLRKEPEVASESGDPAPTLADLAALRPHRLTEELLDWLIHALTVVVATPEVQQLASSRVRSAMTDALKFADHLYPLTLERADAETSSPLPGTAGRTSTDGSVGDL